MPLVEGDHLVIKRNGKILTPDADQADHEYVVYSKPFFAGSEIDPLHGKMPLYAVILKVVR